MANGVNGKKLLGGDRYSQYVDELTTEGTIAGQVVTGEERKEGFKKRGDKINFEKFVNKVLAKKAGVGGGGGAQLPAAGVQKLLPGTADALKTSDDAAEIDGEKQPSLKDVLDFLKNILEPSLTSIEQNLNNILGNLEGQVDANKENAEQLRLQQDSAADDAREATLKAKGSSPIQKTLDKVIKPVSSFFDMILKFFTNVLLGAGVLALLDIINNPEKIMKPIRDFANGVTGFVNDMMKALWKWVINPINWVADGINVGIKAVADGINTVLSLIPGVEDPLPVFQIPIAREAPQIPKWEPPQEAQMQGGGLVPSPQEAQMQGGGEVPGSGKGDVIPAMLEPGEFVMSKGAVDQVGVDNLAAMNAEGGGTNQPTMKDGRVAAEGGGFIGDDKKENRFKGPKNEAYFLKVGRRDGRIQIWNEEFGSDKFVGNLFPANGKFEPNKNWWGGARDFEVKFFEKPANKEMVIGRAAALEAGQVTQDANSMFPAEVEKSTRAIAPPGPPGGGGGKNIVMAGANKTGATGSSGGGTNGGSVTPFSASDIRNDGTLVIKSIYNIVG